MVRGWALGLACAALALAGCRPAKLIPRAKPLPAAPAAISGAEGLPIFVAENTAAPLAQGEHGKPGTDKAYRLAAVNDERLQKYARALRQALLDALKGAGMASTMDPWSGAELVATATSEVTPELEWDQGGVSISTKTALVIGTPHGKALVRAEVSVPASDEDVLDTRESLDRRLETHARRVAAEAVHALAAEPQMAAYLQARRTRRNISALLKQEEERNAAGAEGAHTTTDLKSARDAASAFLAGTAQPSAHGLAIGVEKYADGKSGNAGARSDATRFAGLMMRTMGLPEENVHLAVDEGARRADLEKELAWLAGSMKGEGRLYLFFTGAMAIDPKTGLPSLLPFDREAGAGAASSGLRLEGLFKKLAEGGADVVAVLDACAVGKGKARELKLPAKAILLAAPREACAQGELSLQITEGLGTAQADADGDHAVTFDELRDFVRERMTKEGAKEGPLFEIGKSETGASFSLAEGLDKK
jgi:hypothetical protein